MTYMMLYNRKLANKKLALAGWGKFTSEEPEAIV